MLRFEAKLSLKSNRHVTKSMEGQDRMQRSDNKSLGPETEKTSSVTVRGNGSDLFELVFKDIRSPAAGMMG